MVVIERDICDEEGYCQQDVVARGLSVRQAIDTAKRLIQCVPRGACSPCYTVIFDHFGVRVYVSYFLSDWAPGKRIVHVTRLKRHDT